MLERIVYKSKPMDMTRKCDQLVQVNIIPELGYQARELTIICSIYQQGKIFIDINVITILLHSCKYLVLFSKLCNEKCF